MAEKKKEVLVIEDRLDNIISAIKYFSDQGMEPKIVSTYDDAIKELEKNADKYIGIISDLNFPKSEGRGPEELGFELMKEAKRYGIPVIILTAGRGHHGGMSYYIIPEFSEDSGEKTKEGPKGITKDMPEAWADAYEELKKIESSSLEEIQKARARHKKFTGKQYKR